MLSSDRPDDTSDECAPANAAGAALVAVVPTIRWSPVPDRQRSRADFVAQLIATAESASQTRGLLRAPAEVQRAYGANQHRFGRPGLRTRQVI